ncbi:MAG TPA: aspartate aminotransferase family protein [Thermoanaerobaculia bacterium]|nr:aspartate aminotransferase family protein [Thermoanaerobaculia bacterium]
MPFRYPDSPLWYRRLDRAFPQAVRGEGVWVVAEDGRRYLDAVGGALAVNVGHGVDEIAGAVAAQLRELAYVNGTQFTNRAAEELARELAEVLPEPLRYSYFLASGSEAVEAAVKLARQYWVERGRGEKWKVISRRPSYHGNTLAALSLSGREHYRRVYEPLLTDFPRIAAPDPYRHPGCAACTGAALGEELARQGAETVAAFIAEPIGGSSAGAVVPSAEYYRQVAALCRQNDVLFIADEVLTGCGRTGRWFAFQHFDLVPDILVLGKGLSGGYAPLSAVVAQRHVVDAVARGSGAFNHAQTYSHTPVIAAAGAATLRYLKAHRLVERCAAMSPRLFAALERLRDHPAVGDVRGIGLLAAVELVRDPATREPFPRAWHCAERLVEHAFELGLILWPNVGHVDGVNGDLVMVAPPFTIAGDEIEEIARRLGQALERLAADAGLAAASLESRV